MYLRSSQQPSAVRRVLRTGGVVGAIIGALWLAQRFGVGDRARDLGSRVLVTSARPAEALAIWWRDVRTAVPDATTTQPLQQRIAELEMIAASAREATRERDALRTMLHMAPPATPLVTARVIRHDLATPYKVLTIDRGSADGVRAGQAVMSAAGLVGHVLRTSAAQAIVVVLTDPTHAVDVIDERSRERGVLLGNGDGLALGRQVGVTRLEYMNGTADIRDGDLLITSGLDGRYPAGLPVGTIRSVRKRADGLLESADVTPLIDWTHLELVSVWP